MPSPAVNRTVRKIAIVHDDPAAAKKITRDLKQVSELFAISVFSNKSELLEALRSQAFTLLVSDLGLTPATQNDRREMFAAIARTGKVKSIIIDSSKTPGLREDIIPFNSPAGRLVIAEADKNSIGDLANIARGHFQLRR